MEKTIRTTWVAGAAVRRGIDASGRARICAFLLMVTACGGGSSEGGGPGPSGGSQLTSIDLSRSTDSIVQLIDDHSVDITLHYSGAVPAETAVRVTSASATVIRADTTITATRGSARFAYRGLATGVTTITIAADGSSRQVSVTVLRQPILLVQIVTEFPELPVDDSLQMQARVVGVSRDEIPGVPVTWTVADPSIATISASGVLVAAGVGQTVVTARDTEVGKTGSTTVRVVMPALASIEVGPAPGRVLLGREGDFVATGVDRKGRRYPAIHTTWSTDSPALLLTFPDTGVTYGLGMGQALLRATMGGLSGSLSVTIAPNPVTRIGVDFGAGSGWNGDSLLMWSGDFASSSAQPFDASGNGMAYRPVQWSSSDPSVATITQGGVIHAVAAGSFNVIATIDGVSRPVPGRVRPTPPVTSVVLGYSGFVRVTGQVTTLRATVLGPGDSIMTGRPVTWTSSQPIVARVSENGEVTAASPGTATILATSGGQSSAPFVLTVVADEPGSNWNPVVRIDGPSNVRLDESIRRAIARLRYVIRGDVPDVPVTLATGACYPGSPAITETVDDLLILVRFMHAPNVVDAAGACVTRTQGYLPAVSVVQIDTGIVRNSSRDDIIDDIVLHNFLHAAGMTFPTWNGLSVWSGTGPDPAFFGAMAQAGFRAAGGARYPYRIVPTENGETNVDAYIHWRAVIMRPEIFNSAFIDPDQLHPLSEVTTGALADIGYQVASGTADDFHLGPQVPLLPVLAPNATRTGHRQVPYRTAWRVDPDGTMHPAPRPTAREQPASPDDSELQLQPVAERVGGEALQVRRQDREVVRQHQHADPDHQDTRHP